MPKKWIVAPQITDDVRNRFPELHPVVLQLLYNRGVRTQEQIDEFLNPDWGEDVHDPFLFRDMQKAVDRIMRAIEKKESIVVYGDYDADGVCSSAVLHDILTDLGAHDVHVHLPHRETEGYGLNVPAVKELIKRGSQLIVTCDCGTSNIEEITLAQDSGIDVIVTDHHHQPAKLPKPYAFLNPQLEGETYPFRHLAGVGVAYKLAQALVMHDARTAHRLPEGYDKWLLDLVAISTVTDMMPLIGENRTLVHYGLVVLRKSRRAGIQQLVNVMGNTPEKLDTTSIGFQIGPRLNAAGRMDHANSAFELLIEKDATIATELAEKLDQKNKQRQRLTETLVKDAEKQISEKPEHIMFVEGAEWPVGLIGLVAGRIADRYHRPVFAMTHKGEEIVGSGRSIEAFDITQALVEHAELFDRFGGHSQACGFTLPQERLELFKKTFHALGKKVLRSEDLVSVLSADMRLDLDRVDWELIGTLEGFEPFGEHNPKPRFVAEGVSLDEVIPVGKDGKHLRLMVSQASGLVRKVMAFSGADGRNGKLTAGSRIDMMYEVSVNEWNGNREIQLKLIDSKPYGG
ncbi:MAG: single-stranded-DNA-specific exonuclease RecJ [Patescibacteria group bacterium]|jgi:single-stranded-DNA-specific exonuclease